MYLEKIEHYLKKNNIPVKDLHDLPSSKKTFKGGAHYRMEIAGAECAQNFEALVKAAQEHKLPVHRVIGTVGGSALLEKSELKHYAQIGKDFKTEVVLNCAPTRAWDLGRQYTTREGYVSGMRVRGQDNLYLWLKEFDRCLNAGIRGFLIVDEGLLETVSKMRAEGAIPKDTVFKVSVFAGHGSALSAKLLTSLGADSFNPLADLSLAMLASIRSVTDIPLDVYMSIVDSMGGHQRNLEADEIARICSPVYFKFEPGIDESSMYNTWREPAYQDFLVKQKIRYACIAKEWCEGKGLVFNDYTDDLSIPQP